MLRSRKLVVCGWQQCLRAKSGDNLIRSFEPDVPSCIHPATHVARHLHSYATKECRTFFPMTQLPILQAAELPNTLQWLARSDRGDYLVQVAWPLQWNHDRTPKEDETVEGVNILYVVDGNAYFYSAVDTARRLEFLYTSRTIIVGIGYPPSKYVYDWRRGPDLTPWAPSYHYPKGKDGKPRTDLNFGEADKFLSFIEHHIMPYVEKELFKDVKIYARALYGHSYGGVFALNTMYTRSQLFDAYLAASPTLGWNDHYLVNTIEAEFLKNPPKDAVSLVVAYGQDKKNIEKIDGETDEMHQRRTNCAEEDGIKEEMEGLVARMRSSDGVSSVITREFLGEDHGSVSVVSLQFCMTMFVLQNTPKKST